MTPEGAVKKSIKKILAAYELLWYFMPVSSGYGAHGVPDFIICANGKFIAVEAKAGAGVVTVLQLKCMDKIRRARGCTLVFRDTPNDIALLKARVIACGCRLKTDASTT